MTTPDATGTPPPAPERKRRRRRRPRPDPDAVVEASIDEATEKERPKRGPGARVVDWWGRLNRPILALAGLAGAVATILGLVFLLWPDAQPKGTPDDASASFERLSVEVLTRRQSLDRLGLPTTGFTPQQLAERGGFVSFDLAVSGYGGSRLPVRWLALNSGGDTVSSEDKRTQLRPDRDNQTLTHRFWAPVTPQGGPFRVVVEIYPPGAEPGDPGRLPLRTAETEPFAVSQPAPAPP